MDPTALRSMVAEFLVDTCDIFDPLEAPDFDTLTGDYADDVPGDLVYSGPCRVMFIRGGDTVEAGDTPVTLGALDVRLPWDTTGVEINQLIVVTASNDPQLVGRSLRVTDVQGVTDNPYRRLHAQDTRTVASGAGS